jgi:Asp-tRNA(Asn)/Glu-tRNA(Gln) amidotransferase A subunit family amidase
VPVAVKDLFAMAGTVTTAGSRRAAWPPDAADAAVVERLERAGAVIVGKTRLPEFAFWPGSTNPHYGPTANPRDVGRDAGGSSSGSAAAVADGMAYAALGSDTGGSVRIPAALCGVVGLKPTYGRVSLEGCVPLAWSLDHAGPLTRSVHDAALLLDAMVGSRGGRPGAGPSEDASEASAKGLRVGVIREDGTGRPLASDEALEQWTRSLRALEEAGATVVDVDLPEMSLLRAVNFLILSVEASAYHAAGLRAHYDDYGEPCRSRLLAGFAYDADDFVQAQRARRHVRGRWQSLFDRFDVLSTPSQPGVAPPLGQMASVKFTSPVQRAGMARDLRSVRQREWRAAARYAARGCAVAGGDRAARRAGHGGDEMIRRTLLTTIVTATAGVGPGQRPAVGIPLTRGAGVRRDRILARAHPWRTADRRHGSSGATGHVDRRPRRKDRACGLHERGR